jgi:hypothetical protein
MEANYRGKEAKDRERKQTIEVRRQRTGKGSKL